MHRPLVDEAAAAAAAEGLPLTYVQSNVNDGVFPEGEFDLVVNHAAAHHIASLDRVFRESAASCLRTGGSSHSITWVPTGTSTASMPGKRSVASIANSRPLSNRISSTRRST